MRHAALSTAALLLLLPAAASAADVERSLDTQLVDPALLPGAAFAVDSPGAWRQWAFQGGVAWQFEHMPLEYFENAQSAGAAITSRNTLHLAAGTTVYQGVTVYTRWALLQQDPGVTEDFGPENSFGVSDLGLGVKADLIRSDRLSFGPHFDLRLPTGTKDSWIGERRARYIPGVLLDLDTGPVQVLAHLGLLIRAGEVADTGADFVLGSEIPVGLALGVPITDHFTALAETTGRMGFENLFKPGAENPFEAKAGVRWNIGGFTLVDLAAGTALNNGYGTSDLRILLSLTNVPRPPPVVIQEVVQVEAPKPKAVAIDIPDQQEEIKWEEGQLAQVVSGRIVIRDPIQFEFATSNILPVSQPTLEAVAQVMNEYPQIEHLLIEGHASEEGTFEYNYKLSNARCQAIFEAIVASGVRPERVSYRGMGETVPIASGTDEASLALNRRVVFQIMKVRDFLDVANEDSGSPIIVPHTGVQLPAPKMGDKQLSADASPILVQEAGPPPTPVEKTPDASEFKPTLDDDEGATPPESNPPPAETPAPPADDTTPPPPDPADLGE